jgi:hypothetical protein
MNGLLLVNKWGGEMAATKYGKYVSREIIAVDHYVPGIPHLGEPGIRSVTAEWPERRKEQAGVKSIVMYFSQTGNNSRRRMRPQRPPPLPSQAACVVADSKLRGMPAFYDVDKAWLNK